MAVEVGLRCADLTVSLGANRCRKSKGNVVLKDVTVSVRPNRLTAVLGQSGSGKTTLANVFHDRLDKHEIVKGSWHYHYTDPETGHRRSFPSAESLELQTGLAVRYAMTGHVAFPRVTLRQVLDTTAAIAKVSDARVTRLLSLCQLEDAANRPVMTFGDATGISAGEEKRFAVAKELCSAQHVAFLILDEPTTSLDTGLVIQFVQVLKNLMTEKMVGTVLCNIHQPSPSVYSLFDDIILLHAGRLLFNGPRELLIPTLNSCIPRSPSKSELALPDAERIFQMLTEVDAEEAAEEFLQVRQVPEDAVSEYGVAGISGIAVSDTEDATQVASLVSVYEDAVTPAPPTETPKRALFRERLRMTWEQMKLEGRATCRLTWLLWASLRSTRMVWIATPLVLVCQGLLLAGLLRGSF